MTPVMLALAIGCARPIAPAGPPAPEAPAVLPAPDGAVYTAAPAAPRDPVVAQVAAGLPWDESLSGAGTTLVLDAAGADLDRARWAAWRAAYPHPVVQVVEGRSAPGAVPEGLPALLAQLLRPGDQLGLVRARAPGADRWVALIGRPAVPLGPVPRRVEVGATVEIAVPQGFSVHTLAPDGRLRHTDGPAAFAAGAAGVWWVEVHAPDGSVAAGFPLGVGVDPPREAPVPLPGAAAPGPSAAADRLLEAVNAWRAAAGLSPVRAEPALAALAARPLDGLLSGAFDPAAAERRLDAAGFAGGPRAALGCTAPTPALCVDGWARSVASRASLLHPGLRLAGVGAEARTDGLSAVLLLSAE